MIFTAMACTITTYIVMAYIVMAASQDPRDDEPDIVHHDSQHSLPDSRVCRICICVHMHSHHTCAYERRCMRKPHERACAQGVRACMRACVRVTCLTLFWTMYTTQPNMPATGSNRKKIKGDRDWSLSTITIAMWTLVYAFVNDNVFGGIFVLRQLVVVRRRRLDPMRFAVM